MLRDPAGLAYLAAAAVFACIAVVTWRRRANSLTVAVSLAVVMVGAFWWALALALVEAFPDETVAAIATLAAFPGPATMVAAFVCLGFAISRPQWAPSRRVVAALLVEPALITAAGLTNPWHLWVYAGPGAAQLSAPADWTYGPVFWLDSWYGYASMAVGIGLIARAWWRAPLVFRGQRLALLLAALLPVVANAVFLAGGFGAIVDPTLFGFAVTGTIMAYAILRHELFTFGPVARTLIVDQIGDAIVAISPTGRVLDLNPAAAELVRGMNPLAPRELIGATDRELFGLDLAAAAMPTEVSVPLRGRRADFHVRSSPLIDRRRRALGTVLVARDVTEANAQTRRLSEANAQLLRQVETIDLLRADLVQLASRDSLTGLHNRRHMLDRFGPMLEAAARTGEPLTVVLLDVDRFKSINDEHGHLAGDKVLVAIAQRMREQAPPGALVARWGGEEFFIALPGADAVAGLSFAEEVRHRCERHGITVAGRTIRCTLSGGVATYPGSGTTMIELFHAADVALYEAKAGGRNVVQLHAERADGAGIDATG